MNVLFLGDSTIKGVGDASAPAAADDLHFGGASIPAGIEAWDEGVALSAWPSNSGAGPEPGIMPHVGEDILAAGYTTARLARFGTTGQTTQTIRATDLHEAFAWCVANNFVPDLVVVGCGSNDSQTGESTGFNTAARNMLRDLERTWPSVRVCWIKPVPLSEGSYPEADAVRGHIDTFVSEKSTRCKVENAGVGRADAVHPSLDGYRVQGHRVIPAYQGAG